MDSICLETQNTYPQNIYAIKTLEKKMLCLASEVSKTSFAPQYAPPRTYVKHPLVVERLYLQKIPTTNAKLQ